MREKARDKGRLEDIIEYSHSMRHVLVHGYASIKPDTLYETATTGIPELCEQIEKYLANTDWEQWEKDDNIEQK